jgi:hypothetical protein
LGKLPIHTLFQIYLPILIYTLPNIALIYNIHDPDLSNSLPNAKTARRDGGGEEEVGVDHVI